MVYDIHHLFVLIDIYLRDQHFLRITRATLLYRFTAAFLYSYGAEQIMKSITVRLDTETIDIATRDARAEGISLSALIRRRLQTPAATADDDSIKEHLRTISVQLSAVQTQLAQFETTESAEAAY